ncbi:MAG: signal peptidase II [Solirubrobacteraceae bacterium]
MHRLQEWRAVPALSDGPVRRRTRSSRIAVMVVVAIVVLAADQVTKSLAVSGLSHHSVHLFGPFYLALSYNSGVAFSIGAGLTFPIVVIVVVLVVAIGWFGRGVPTTPAAVAIGLIVGGAVGNLADRFFRDHHGAVIDFLYSGFWPTFNLADASIVCGSILIAVVMLRASRRLPPARRETGRGPRPESTEGDLPGERGGRPKSRSGESSETSKQR